MIVDAHFYVMFFQVKIFFNSLRTDDAALKKIKKFFTVAEKNH